MSQVTEAICKKLQADTGAGGVMVLCSDVYPDLAPEEATFPYVIVTSQSPAVDAYSFGGIVTETSIVLVKVVDQNTNPAPAEDARNRIQTVLQDANISLTGQTVLWLRRKSQFPEMAEVVEGITYIYRGALYDVIVSDQ